MDISTFIGLILTWGLMLWACLLGGSLRIFFDVPSILITIGGSLACLFTNFPLPTVLSTFGVIRNAFITRESSPLDIITTLVSFSERARREGILSLENHLNTIEDDFIQNGLRLAVDGVEPELIKDIMQTELAFIEDRHRTGQSILLYLADVAPAMGMIGTLIGLVQMLQTLNDPSTIGPSMAVAILTTLYGALLANTLFKPMAAKLKARTSEEVLLKEVAIEGIMSIQQGDNPRILEQKLLAYLSPRLRPAREE